MNKFKFIFRALDKIYPPLRIVLFYLLVGALWILFSDQLLSFAVRHDDTHVLLSIFKGLFYVAVTGLLLFWLINRSYQHLRNSQKKLRESEQLFRDMSNGAPVMLWMSDSSGNIYFVNQRWQELSGRTDLPGQGTGWSEVIHPEDLPHIEKTYQAAHQNRQYFETEVRLKKTDAGYYRRMLVSGTPRFADNGEFCGFAGSCLDITDRKQAEEGLKIRERLYRQMFEFHGLPKLLIDPETAKIVDANPAAAEFYGYSMETLKTLNLTALSTLSMPEIKNNMSKATANRMILLRVVHRLSGGELRRIEAYVGQLELNGKPLIYSTIADVTEKEEAKAALEEANNKLEQRVARRTAALEESNNRLAAIFNHSDDGLLLLGLEHGIQQANHAFETLLGLEHDSYQGKSLGALVQPEEAEIVEEAIRDVARTGQKRQVEIQVARPGCEVCHLEINIAPVERHEGNPANLVCILHDITPHKQAEQAMKEALAHEKELNELKSRFVSMASHEFRTPLAAILATTETLTIYRARMEHDQINIRLDKIRQQVVHMTALIEDVLQLARIQMGRVEFKPAADDLAAFCSEIVADFESHPQNQNRIDYTPPAHPLLTEFDPHLMRKIFNNLISNALKYSPPEKTIRVELYEEKGQISFKVTDEGIGIPPEDLKHLFKPFHRAKNVGRISGTGLGLSITRESIEMHGGTIQVDSRLDNGTCMTVILPVARPD
jgi:PAS domain S-box-containing protein